MAENTDPNAGHVGTAGRGPDQPVAGGSEQDAGTISLADHQRTVAEERNRRSGQERAHQKEVAGLKERLEALEQRLTNSANSGGATSADLSAVLERLRSRDPNVRAEAAEEAIVAAAEWTQHLKSREERDRARDQVEVELLRLEAVGVPRDALDTSTVAAIKASAAEWQRKQEMIILKQEIEDLKKSRSAAEQEASTAATRERQRLGATSVPTSTGSSPALPSEVEEELAGLETQIAYAKRQRQGDVVMALTRRRNALRAATPA